ncbi:MAG: CPBP family intramembrane metalloprotease [Actinomycetota bacterium]|nr:CPBP family intramembrane metalloprotease [Actinomycetota bacterium]
MARPPAPADYPGCPVTVTEAIAAGRPLVPPRWGLWGVAGALAGSVVVAVVVGLVLYLVDAPISVQIIVGVTAPWLVLAGWPLLATRLRGNGARIDLGLRLTWSDTGWGALGGLVALLLAGIAATITQVFVPDLTSAAAEAAEELERESGRLALTAFALIVLVGAPVVEELFFRGFLYGALRKRGVGTALTVIVSAVVFAGFHLEPLRFLVLLPTGLVLGWVRARTESTGASMVAHGFVNAPGAVLLLVGIDGMSP